MGNRYINPEVDGALCEMIENLVMPQFVLDYAIELSNEEGYSPERAMNILLHDAVDSVRRCVIAPGFIRNSKSSEWKRVDTNFDFLSRMREVRKVIYELGGDGLYLEPSPQASYIAGTRDALALLDNLVPEAKGEE